MRLAAPAMAWGGPRPWSRALRLYALYLAALAPLALPGLEAMARSWATASYSHGAVAAPVSLLLVWLKRDRLRALAPRIWPLATAAVAASTALLAAGLSLDAQIIQHAAIVGALVAGVAMIFGRRIAREIAFPLGFLIFMVPFGESAVPVLRVATAEASAALISVIDPAASLDRFVITTSGGRFHVAEACAGLHMTISTLMVATFLANYALAGWRNRVLLIAAGLALAAFANILRVVIVIAAAIVSGGDAGLAADHDGLGLVLYAGVFAFLAFLAARLGRSRRRRE